MYSYAWRDPELLGSSDVMHRLRAQLARLAQVPWPARLEGATGTGKGVAARLLHQWSPRAGGPFVTCYVNMLPHGLELAELVGYVRGAFTGAVSDHAGVFERAHDGTLFLDELATATLRVQQALLQLVEEGTVCRLGEERPRQIDTRLVFSTNVDLEEAVVAGTFRRDLHYRLGTLIVRMPLLQEHREDIPELVETILERKAHEAGTPFRRPRDAIMQRMLTYEWPGNVRQLDRALEHYLVFGRLPAEVTQAPLAEDWRARLDDVLARHGGNKSAAAKELGVSRKTLYEELKRRRA